MVNYKYTEQLATMKTLYRHEQLFEMNSHAN